MRRAPGRYFRKWLGKLKLSYADVAARLGVHETTVRNWEKDGARPMVKLAFDRAFRTRTPHKVVAPFGKGDPINRPYKIDMRRKDT